MKNTKYTVLIPTRERAETLFYTIKTCLEQSYDNLEIIISDNFSNDNTEQVVKSFSDKRIRYVKTPHRMSMSDNFEYALSFVNDGYVMFIGDDDGILPGAINYVNEIVEKTGQLAITSAIAQYAWPNHPDENYKNSMSWSVRSDVEIRKSKEWLSKMLEFEFLYTFELPGLYCGFVHIDIVNAMKKNGRFFYSQVPDAYSAFACALELNEYAYSYFPFSIHGASGRSNGASYLDGKNKEEANNFLKENTIPFHENLVQCPSFRIIAAEAFLQVKSNFPIKAKDYNLNYYKLLANVRTEKNLYNSVLLDNAILEICKKNGLEFHNIKLIKKPVVFRIINKIKSILNRFGTFKKYSYVKDATKLQVFNVYDASKAFSVLGGINNSYATQVYQQIGSRFTSKVFKHKL